MNTIVSVSRLNVVFPPPRRRAASVVALRDLDLVVSEGERVGIIGRNGAGKSTLLAVLAGVLGPTSGQVDIAGEVHAVLELGLMFNTQRTGRQNVALEARVAGAAAGTELDALVEAIGEFTELGPAFDRPVRTYSSGMRARLAFATIAFSNPDVLLIDEALSAGDVFFARKARTRILELCEAGRAVLIVSHAMGAIRDLCTRCIWLDEGRVVADGDPVEVTAAFEDAMTEVDPDRGGRTVVDVGSGLEVRLCSAGGSVTEGARLEAEIVVGPSAAAPGALLRATLERADGLRLTETEHLLATRPGPGSGSVTTGVLEFEDLHLGMGFYELVVEVVSDGVAIERAGLSFEVPAEHSFSGGRPLLDPPIDIGLLAR